MEESSYSNLSTSHLLGSVPAVTNEEKKASYEVPEANMQIFPPNNGSGGGRGRGYQTLEAPTEEFEQQPPNNWSGVFSISSYTQYFNVDTDVVIYRLICSFYPVTGDFFSKIDANPDLKHAEDNKCKWYYLKGVERNSNTIDLSTHWLHGLLHGLLHQYGLIWITTTLVFMLASFGNWATYLMQKHSDGTTTWSFDVGYINAAAVGIYGYAVVVPMAFNFLLQYLGSNASLVRFLCMWGYSFSIFIPTALLLLIPVEILRWIIILIAGSASSCFVALNLKSYIEGADDLKMMVVAAFLLQMALAIFIKVWFFP
ncbi:protein YIPF1-like protein isoform X1 [Gossypium australe]|uniref:Protein YIP n=1 Tax=Gossypium australe TaxID=47621 RepID=A0A5B6U5F8_9ROSI|nr:protein YIPF1-like protein isoform X1 [Gossypium australe]